MKSWIGAQEFSLCRHNNGCMASPTLRHSDLRIKIHSRSIDHSYPVHESRYVKISLCAHVHGLNRIFKSRSFPTLSEQNPKNCSKVKCQKSYLLLRHSPQGLKQPKYKHCCAPSPKIVNGFNWNAHPVNQPASWHHQATKFLPVTSQSWVSTLLEGFCARAMQANMWLGFMISCSKQLRVLFLWALIY